jgi:hypothetical protein
MVASQTKPEEIVVQTKEDAEKYLLNAPTLAKLGEELVFRVSLEVLDSWREQLRASFPEAVLRPIPPRRRWSADTPKAYPAGSTPMLAPANYRTLPPVQRAAKREPPGGGFNITHRGSGVPAAQHPSGKDIFARCMHCASADTLVIYNSSSTHYGRGETWRWEATEYECRECGRINYHQYSEEW